MNKQELMITVILFIFWIENSMLLAVWIDNICKRWQKRRVLKAGRPSCINRRIKK